MKIELLATTLNLKTVIAEENERYPRLMGVTTGTSGKLTAKEIKPVFNRSLTYLLMSETFNQYFKNEVKLNNFNNKDINGLKNSTIKDPIIFLSFVVFNNIYNMISTQEKEGTEKVNISSIYGEVFKNLRTKQMSYISNVGEVKKYKKNIFLLTQEDSEIRRNDMIEKLDLFDEKLKLNLDQAIGIMSFFSERSNELSFFFGENIDLKKSFDAYIKVIRKEEWNRISTTIKKIIDEVINPDISFAMDLKAKEVENKLDEQLSKCKKILNSDSVRALEQYRTDKIIVIGEITCLLKKLEQTKIKEFAIKYDELLSIEKEIKKLNKIDFINKIVETRC